MGSPPLHALLLCVSAGSFTLNLENLIVAPNGVSYVPPSVRPGVLPHMLHEILATRIMVKSAMKRTSPADKVCLQQLLSTVLPCCLLYM